MRAARSFDAPSNAPYRYALSDPAVRFHHALVNRYRAELETNDPHGLVLCSDQSEP